MGQHSNASGRGAALLAAAVIAMTTSLAACSSSGGGAAGGSGVPASQPAAASSAGGAPASSAPAASAGLSGKWKGSYGGAFQGTFTLRWRQSGSRLSGTIRLSQPAQVLAIHGSVQGGRIRFGTVGSTAITYSGSVSGDSMSGTYQVSTGSSSAGGAWSASKS